MLPSLDWDVSVLDVFKVLSKLRQERSLELT